MLYVSVKVRFVICMKIQPIECNIDGKNMYSIYVE